MKVFNKIIQSDAEPSRNNIWFKDKKLWFYNNNGWEALTDEVGKPADLTGYLKESDIGTRVAGLITNNIYGKKLLDNYIKVSANISRLQIADMSYSKPAISADFNNGLLNISITGYTNATVNSVYDLTSTQTYNNPLCTLESLQGVLKNLVIKNRKNSELCFVPSLFTFVNEYKPEATLLTNPITLEKSNEPDITTRLLGHYFNGSRDISPTATNIVQEKGLYTVINNFRDTILGEDGKLKRDLIGLYNGIGNNKTNTIITYYTGCPVNITYKQGKLALDIYTYDGARDIDVNSTNLVQERGLLRLKSDIDALDNTLTEYLGILINNTGRINGELIPPHNFTTDYTVDPSETSVILQGGISSDRQDFLVRTFPVLTSSADIEHFLTSYNGYIPNLVNAGHLFMVANYLNNKIVAPDKVPVKAGAGVTVSKSDSDITIDIKDYDKLAKVAVLNVGATAEVKTHNQAQIPTDRTTFFVQIENGIGVAKFTTTGGSAVVTTGEGTRVKYNIGPGYSCSKDIEYFEVTDLVYTMPDIALTTLDSTTNMTSLLTDEQADQIFKCSYIKFNLKKMSGEHVLGTLPITCSCSSLGFSEKVFQTPTLSIGNTDFTNIKITVKKMTPEGGTEEHWYAVLETV